MDDVRWEEVRFTVPFVVPPQSRPYCGHVVSKEVKRASLPLKVQNEALKAACPVPFDEGRMWKSDDGELLKHQLQQHFQNMTKAMDCVGCEKCKLWGKLQLLGKAQNLLCALYPRDSTYTKLLSADSVIATI